MMDANKQILNQITGGWNLQAVTPWAAYAKHFPQLRNSTIFPFALQAAMVGWFVFPCIPGDKRPACKWKDNATNDPSQVAKIWAKTPDANYGIVCGEKSRILVVDIDNPQTWAEFKTKHQLGDLEHSTFSVRTGGGGLHLYFAYTPEAAKLLTTKTNTLGAGIDTRGNGGYVIGLGCAHKSGNCYQAESLQAVKPIPEDFAAALQSLVGAGGASPDTAPAVPNAGSGLTWQGKPVAQTNEASDNEIEATKRVLCFVPNQDYTTWLYVGLALGRKFGQSDAGFDLFQEWSDKDYQSNDKNRARLMHDIYYEQSTHTKNRQITWRWVRGQAVMNGFAELKPIADLVYIAESNDFLDSIDRRHYGAAGIDATFSPVPNPNDPSKLMKASEYAKAHCQVSCIAELPNEPFGIIRDLSVTPQGDVFYREGANVFNIFSAINVPFNLEVQPRNLYTGGAMGRAYAAQHNWCAFDPNGTPLTDVSWGADHWEQIQKQAYSEALPWIEHCKTLFGPEAAEVFIKYQAFKYQYPGKKLRWSIVLAGEQGVGKDAAINGAWGTPWAQGSYKAIDSEAIFSQFNTHVTAKMLSIQEASSTSNDARFKFTEAIKVLVAGNPDRIIMNEKNEKKRPVTLVNGTLITTNHPEYVLKLDPDDRRHYIVECTDRFTLEQIARAHGVPNLSTYFNNYHNWLNNGGFERVAYLLMYGVDLTDFNPNYCPEATAAKAAMIEENIALEPQEYDILEAVASAYTQSSSPMARVDSEGMPIIVATEGLTRLFTAVGKPWYKGPGLTNFLKKAGYERIVVSKTTARFGYNTDSGQRRLVTLYAKRAWTIDGVTHNAKYARNWVTPNELNELMKLYDSAERIMNDKAVF